RVSTIRCAMFNLGYLPGSDKTFQTDPELTIKALNAVITHLQQPGIISVLAYTGHAGGREEAEAVKAWAATLSQTAYRVTIEIPDVVKNSPPELILIETIQ
ncbi:MAG: SAM-dependent methyltransferase, partial [Gammaproteobacteria bacterium]